MCRTGRHRALHHIDNRESLQRRLFDAVDWAGRKIAPLVFERLHEAVPIGIGPAWISKGS